MTPVLIVPGNRLYSEAAQRRGCQVPIAVLISPCKCVTSEWL